MFDNQMTIEERTAKIEQLKSQIRAFGNNRAAKKFELIAECFDLEFVLISWHDLEKWMIENKPQSVSDRMQRPVVYTLNKMYSNYCRINNDGVLCIGAYYSHDQFPRGRDLYVHFNFMPFYEWAT